MCAVAAQVIDLGIRVSAGDDREILVGDPPGLDECTRLEGIWDGADEPTRAGQVRRLQQSAVCGSADDDLHAFILQMVDQTPLLLNHQEWDVVLPEARRDVPPDAAVPDEHRVVLNLVRGRSASAPAPPGTK